uniref:Uncharacterized protein n=1 Tax=Entomoneis paludosa TaxID=265537 RepID=A0A7S2V7E3_9STRA
MMKTRRCTLFCLVALLAVATIKAFVPVPTARRPALAIDHSAPQQQFTPSSSRIPTTALQNFFSGLGGQKEEAPEPRLTVIDPDFRVAALFLAIGGALDTIPYIQLTLGPLVTALGVLFLVQTFRLRFIFDQSAFELVTVSSDEEGETLGRPGENIIVGGENRWATSSIFNYDFFPEGWIDGPVGPILVYFKEDQTPSSSWNEGPGKMANDPEKVAAGVARPGQVHFFPAVANAQQLREEFEKRGCKKI